MYLFDHIEQYKKEIEDFAATNMDELENYRLKFLSPKGVLKSLFLEMKNIPADKKKEFGQTLNTFKELAESKYEKEKSTFGDKGGIYPKKKAMWMMGLDVGQTKRPFSSVDDAIAACDEIIDIFMSHYPPLTANYWWEVRGCLEEMKTPTIL